MKHFPGCLVTKAGLALVVYVTVAPTARGETVFGDQGDDYIVTGDDDDIIYADLIPVDDLGGDDTVYAGGGDDLVYGFGGDNTIFGEDGNDTLITADGDDYIDAGSGDDPDIQSGRGDDEVYGGDGNDTLRGGEDDDFIDGGDGNDRVIGGSDDDILVGGGGNDTLEGRDGRDTLIGGRGVDTFLGGDNRDTVDYSYSGSDFLEIDLSAGEAIFVNSGVTESLNGIENAIGSTGDNTITGDDDSNVLDGIGGDDTLIGNGGNDILSGGRGFDRFFGGDGNDTVDFGYSASDTLNINLDEGIASFSATYIESLESIENAIGSRGDNTIVGDNGANVLQGLGGDDTIDGKGGIDRVRFSGKLADYTIVETATGDRITDLEFSDGDDGIDTVTDVEFADFTDASISLHGGEPTGALIAAGLTADAVDEVWYAVDFAGGPVAGTPVVLASMQTYDGADTAGLRLRDVGTDGFEVLVEEERSGDAETGHTFEVVGYAVFAPGEIADGGGAVIGEAGRVTLGQSDGDQWHTLNFAGSYVEPVVVMNMTTYNGSQPAHIRIDAVGATSFDWQIEEWGYLDQAHVAETVDYVVLESGVHTLADGTVVEVGTFAGNHAWADIAFAAGFASTPVVLSRSQRYAGRAAVVTRQRNAAGGGVQIRLQEEEAYDDAHPLERVGYIAVEG